MTKILGDIVRDTLRADEDEDLRVLGTDLVEVLDQFASLIKIAADFDDLLDVVVRSKFHGTDVALNHILQEILRIGQDQRNTPKYGPSVHTAASFWTSFGQVALNMRV